MNITIVIAEIMRPERPHRKIPLDDYKAYKDGRCKALKEMCCLNEECKFYKF